MQVFNSNTTRATRGAMRSPRTLAAILMACAALVSVAPRMMQAQKILYAGVGAGTGVGQRGAVSGVKSTVHGMAFFEAHLPLLPLGVRVDGMLLDAGKGAGPMAVTADGVITLPLPVLQPYALAGYGRYGIARDDATSGWNVGLGARITTGPLHIFGEVRRHQRLARDLFTVGITL